MHNEGKSTQEILNYLMAIHGMEQTIANATVTRIINALDSNGNFKTYTHQQIAREKKLWNYIFAIAIIATIIGLLYSGHERIINICHALCNYPQL